MGKMVYSEMLELFACGANIAGHMEAKEKIYVDSDDTLAHFLVEKVNDYCESNTFENFHEYIERVLLEEFKTEVK